MSPDTAFVVSPTEYGGQIEHAFDTAVALSLHPDVEKVVLLTRPGASAYLKDPDLPGLEIHEVFPPRRTKGSTVWNAIRPIFQVVDVITEHLAIRREMPKSRDGRVLLVLDTSRYPLPRLLLAKAEQARIAIFVHNARPHVAEHRRSLRDHVLLFLERNSINGADIAVTHGDQQLTTVASYTHTKVASVPLPTTSFLDEPVPSEFQSARSTPYSLCIGELRENKGVEVAIMAAERAGVDLIVAGKSHDETISRRLSTLAAHNPGTVLIDEFLDKSQFDSLLSHARVVLLPYTHFDAQSGILAKAMKAGRPIIASDLPALREQAGDYPAITFVTPGDVEELQARLTLTMSSQVLASTPKNEGPEQEWNAVANLLLTNV